ncbi:MAG: L-seryl-tRNA(Sec) selenium transferase [Acidimicrobiia bacterium]|nr:L-seryl-tRNA(Sec) selenium transferase [Acidimicrobiia bacterium]
MNADGATWHTSGVEQHSEYRDLPSVDELASGFEPRLPWPLLSALARDVIGAARAEISAGKSPNVIGEMENAVRSAFRSSGVKVINATGVLLHTNMGRAPWAASAIEAAARAVHHYSNLELDLETGGRGMRGQFATDLLKALIGAEDAVVVNNNAGALLLALAALSKGRSVAVSRGELIEIGGAYRLPEVMEASGATLVEVGTTNRTRLGDYETALQVHDCAAILKVHPSNYSIEGFTAEARLRDLAGLARSGGALLIHDIGSGLLDEATPWLTGPRPAWLLNEPGARQSIDSGADVVTFSGDKLLGGPQAGIAVGSAEAIREMRNHPLARALRVDGSTLAALTATLEAYARGRALEIPFWKMALAEADEIRVRAERLATRVGGRVEAGKSAIGAGSAPASVIPSAHLVLDNEDHVYGCLLQLETPIVARRESGALLLDLRTVDPDDDETVADGIAKCR